MVDEQTLKKPTIQAKLHENEEKISCDMEVVENYNVQGDLGIFLEFKGIGPVRAFLRGRRDYGPDTTLFYAPIIYHKSRVLLLLSTCGDIFETQVVPEKKDVNPHFQKEIYLPQLATIYNPRSMAISGGHNLVVVSYQLIP